MLVTLGLTESAQVLLHRYRGSGVCCRRKTISFGVGTGGLLHRTTLSVIILLQQQENRVYPRAVKNKIIFKSLHLFTVPAAYFYFISHKYCKKKKKASCSFKCLFKKSVNILFAFTMRAGFYGGGAIP